MSSNIVVINPSSNERVTRTLDAALDSFRDESTNVHCLTLVDGPDSISNFSDRYAVAGRLRAMVIEYAEDTDAFVIGSLDGAALPNLRNTVDVPIFGMGECSIYTALSLGDRIGLLADDPADADRCLHFVRELGLEHRIAGHRTVPASSTEGGNLLEDIVLEGRLLQAEGADVLIPVSTALLPLRDGILAAFDIPVVFPVQTAVGVAAGVAKCRRPRPVDLL